MLLLGDIVIGLILVLILILVFTIIAHIWVATPFVPTPNKIVESMITLADMRGDEKVYDLGAGDGKILIAAKRRFLGIRAEGFEIALGVWLLGKIRIALSRQHVTLRMRNSLHQNLRDADVIFLYLLSGMMEHLESKFDSELRPGTKVVSHAFQFPGRKPVKELRVPWGRKEKKLFLYIW